jgi:hypothetical protein
LEGFGRVSDDFYLWRTLLVPSFNTCSLCIISSCFTSKKLSSNLTLQSNFPVLDTAKSLEKSIASQKKLEFVCLFETVKLASLHSKKPRRNK